MSVAIFGACREGREVFHQFKALYIAGSYDAEPVCYVDNDSRLIDTYLDGVPVVTPDKIASLPIKKIVIGVIFNDQIERQLRSHIRSDQEIEKFFSDDFYAEQDRTVGLARVGAFSYYKPSTVLFAVDVGRYCHIGADCRIGLVGHNPRMPVTYPFKYHSDVEGAFSDVSKLLEESSGRAGRVIIEDGVYIGEGVSIFGSVTIGRGSVIGSKALVTKDVPPYSIASGAPATSRPRNISKTVIEKLEASKWWTGSPDEAVEAIEMISKSEV